MKANKFQEVISTKQNRDFLIDYLIGDVRELTDETIEEVKEDDAQQLEEEYLQRLEQIKEEEPEDCLTVVLIPTYGCNLRCEYCYEGKLTYSFNYSKLDIQKVKKAIICFKDHFGYTNIAFVLLGGEPIQKRNLCWFNQFFSEFKLTKIPYEIKCISNGVEIAKEIDTLLELGVNCIQITLDGMEKQQNARRPAKDKNINTFNCIVDGIDALLSNGISVNVRINVDEKNVTELVPMHQFFDDKGWWDNDNFIAYIYPISFNGNDTEKKYLQESEILSLVTEQLLKISNCLYDLDFHGVSFINNMLNQEIFYPSLTFCEATTNQVVFDDTGKISTCWWGTSIDDFILGNTENVLSEEFLSNMQKWRNREISKMEECTNCKYKFICGGGCSYKAYLQHGDFTRGRCSTFSENIKVYLEYLIADGRL